MNPPIIWRGEAQPNALEAMIKNAGDVLVPLDLSTEQQLIELWRAGSVHMVSRGERATFRTRDRCRCGNIGTDRGDGERFRSCAVRTGARVSNHSCKVSPD
jgi:hypothetical protein